jgi:predicted transcriptional regulator
MRTTVDLSDEAYRAVKAIARDRDESMGKVMSELILKGVSGPADLIGKIRTVNGWPVVSYGKVVTSEDVRKIRDEEYSD